MAETYDVYFGEQGNMVLQSSGQSGTTWAIPAKTLEYGKTYEWRIDSIDIGGTTTGDIWTFSTIAYAPPLPAGVTLDTNGNPVGSATGENNMVTLRRLVAAAADKIYYESV